MRRVLDPADFAAWFARFLPRLGEGQPATLFTPATVSDRSDGKIAHLDGLNLSRAWCLRVTRRGVRRRGRRPRRRAAPRRRRRTSSASLPHVAGDYMGEHWLASFALLALAA